MRLFNLELNYILETDASLVAVKVVLKQYFGDTELEHLVSFFNRALTTTDIEKLQRIRVKNVRSRRRSKIYSSVPAGSIVSAALGSRSACKPAQTRYSFINASAEVDFTIVRVYILNVILK